MLWQHRLRGCTVGWFIGGPRHASHPERSHAPSKACLSPHRPPTVHPALCLQRNGQRARLTSEAGQAVLDALDAAEAALPAQQEVKSLLPFL